MIDELIGFKDGIPDVEEPRFQDWLKQNIKDTYQKVKVIIDDSILVENYISQMNLYRELYHICYIPEQEE